MTKPTSKELIEEAHKITPTTIIGHARWTPAEHLHLLADALEIAERERDEALEDRYIGRLLGAWHAAEAENEMLQRTRDAAVKDATKMSQTIEDLEAENERLRGALRECGERASRLRQWDQLTPDPRNPDIPWACRELDAIKTAAALHPPEGT